jgi:polyhydroxybutyrate depolymerase
MKKTFSKCRVWILCGILVTFTILSARPGWTQGTEFENGINTVTLKHENVDREFIVYLPNNFKPERTYPVLFAFHGGGGKKEMMAEAWLTNYLDTYDLIGVMPQGLLKSWNSEDHEGFVSRMSTADDIGFVKKMVTYLIQHFNIDNSRIYAYGISNGAVMTLTLARKTDLFAAIVAQSGTMLEVQDLLPGAERISVFLIHGKKDINVPYEGGKSETLLISFRSVRETAEIWARHNGSKKDPLLEKRDNGLTVHRYPDCQDNTNVIFYSFEDAPHNIRPKVAEFKLLDEIFGLITGQSK